MTGTATKDRSGLSYNAINPLRTYTPLEFSGERLIS